jgi:hypothetical protein
MPATAAEWTTLLAGSGINNPSSLYIPGNHATGNLTDVIGGKTFVANGTITYQSAIAGASSLGVKCRENQAGDYFVATDVNVNASSVLQLMYTSINTNPAAVRALMSFGGGSVTEARVANGRLPYASSGVNNATGATAWTLGAPTALLLSLNRAIPAVGIFTPAEIVTPVYSAPGSGTDHYIGAGFSPSTDDTKFYIARWTGASAELNTNQMRTLLQRLGHTVVW